jgi:hypothetical protein
MAAKPGNKNAVGKHRTVDINDKKLAAQVRSLALQEIRDVLVGEHPFHKDVQFCKQLLLKLAGTVLPRLNEHSGEGGGPVQMQWLSQSPTNPESGPKPSTTP